MLLAQNQVGEARGSWEFLEIFWLLQFSQENRKQKAKKREQQWRFKDREGHGIVDRKAGDSMDQGNTVGSPGSSKCLPEVSDQFKERPVSAAVQ